MFPIRVASLMGSNFAGTRTPVVSESVSVSNSYHVAFDGDDDYIQLPSTLGSVITHDSNWSITAWVKYDDSGAGFDAIIASGDTGSRFFIRIENDDGQVRCTADGGSHTKNFTTGYLEEDVWTLVTMVYTYTDTNELVYYKDTTAQTAANFNMSGPPDTDNAQIGVRRDSYDDYKGNIAMLGVFSKALSSAEVSAIHGTPGYVLSDISDCELWYRMGDGTEDGSGTTINDMSGNGLHGSLEGDAAIAAGGVD